MMWKCCRQPVWSCDENAYEGMDRYATYVTERDNNHDGVAEIIEKFILK